MIEYLKLKNGGVREGDMLAHTIYDERGMILLKRGAKITAKTIDSLNQQGFKGIYYQMPLKHLKAIRQGGYF